MKYTLALLAGFIAFTLAGCDDRKIDYSKLPDAAQTFITRFFAGESVTFAERDRDDDGRKEYEVRLSGGTELKFDESGNWESVDCKFSTIPEGIIPPVIAAHISANYPDVSAYKIEKEPGGYEVSVTGNLELIYSSNGTFVREQAGN